MLRQGWRGPCLGLGPQVGSPRLVEPRPDWGAPSPRGWRCTGITWEALARCCCVLSPSDARSLIRGSLDRAVFNFPGGIPHGQREPLYYGSGSQPTSARKLLSHPHTWDRYCSLPRSSQSRCLLEPMTSSTSACSLSVRQRQVHLQGDGPHVSFKKSGWQEA